MGDETVAVLPTAERTNGASVTPAELEPEPVPAGVGRRSSGWQEVVTRETDAAFAAVKRNAVVDLFLRLTLFVVAICGVSVAVWWAAAQGEEMVQVLLSDEEARLRTERVVALILPVLLLLVLSVVALMASWITQSRGATEFERGMEGVSRIRREADIGVSRTRTSTHALEEYYNNARRAFRLQLWLSRTFFVVCLVLFSCAVVDALVRKVDIWTVALGAGSVTTLLVATLTGAGAKVGSHLADATQIQTVIAGATRQINVLEDHMYQVLESCTRTPELVQETIERDTKHMSEVVTTAVELIQRYAEPPNESEKQDQPPRR